ncbi:MAG: MFS transporter [Clostridiales bacterium]|jgi:Na+/melibiose symporter-like transporter|nr:MFS transporter [Clostridiales bacterium]
MDTSPKGKKTRSFAFPKIKKILNATAYASGYALGGGVAQIQTLYYMNFLLYAMIIPAWQVAIILGVSKLWDGFIDPIIGVFVDKTKSKLGNCRPWILVSVVPIFITYFMLWYNFGITGEAARFVYFFFAQILFSTASSIGTVPYEALLPRMVDGYNERTNFSAFRMIFSGIYAVGCTWIYSAVINVKDLGEYHLHTKEFMTLGLLFGVMFSIPMLTTFLGTKETAKVPSDEKLSVKNVFKSYAQLLKSKLYRKFYTLNMLGSFISYCTSISLVIFVLLVYGDLNPVPLIGGLTLPLALSFLTVNLRGAFEIGFFVPNLLMMKKFNKQFPLKVDLPLLFIGCIILLFTGKNVPVIIPLTGIAFLGAGISCLSIVPSTLIPDLPDIDELIYGKRREGESAGLLTLGKQLVQGLCFLIFGFVLEAFKLSEETASPDIADARTLTAVKIMLCLLPFVGIVAMYFVSKSYNLDAKNHALIKARIAEKHEKGFAEVLEDEQKIFSQITGIEYKELWIAQKENS